MQWLHVSENHVYAHELKPYAKLEKLRKFNILNGIPISILMISSELPEVLHVSDRVLVMHEGRLTADLAREQASEEAIMKAAVS